MTREARRTIHNLYLKDGMGPSFWDGIRDMGKRKRQHLKSAAVVVETSTPKTAIAEEASSSTDPDTAATAAALALMQMS